MSQQATEPGQQTPATGAGAPGQQSNPPAAQGGAGAQQGTPGDGQGAGGKEAVLADLAKERDARQALQQQLDTMKADQQAQNAALAVAFGFKPEESSDTDRLTQQVSGLTEQVVAANRRAVSLATKVPEAMLTATDLAGMEAQAAALVEFAQGAAYAAALAPANGAATAAGQQTPGFVTSAGQGNNGGTPPALAAQIAKAEAEAAALPHGTPERRAAQQKVMNLKTQQIAGGS